MEKLPIGPVVEYIVRYLDALERVVLVDVFISVMAWFVSGFLLYQHIKDRKAKKGEVNGSL
jgi:hypothetical protein